MTYRSARLSLAALTAAVLAAAALLAGCVSGRPGGAGRGIVLPRRRPQRERRYGLLVERMLLEDDPEGYNRRYKRPGPMPGNAPRYVTIHNTWNVAPAINERNYVDRRRDRKHISFHYAVDEHGAIQLLEDNERGWHAGDGNGDGNLRSIGIEICRSRCTGDRERLYRRAEANAVLLAAWLLDRYGLPDDALRKHQDWSGKFCPHRILAENRWPEFRRRVLQARRKGTR